MSSLTLRRSLVILATVASVFGGAVAIRAAAGWTGSSAPLAAPLDAAALVARLQDEKARADAITQELSQVVDRATQLQEALAAAEAKASVDAQSAADLAAQLASAQRRLATLERQLAGQAATRAAAPPPTAAPSSTEPEHEEDDD
jgi:septal ring factor EnvC (AmiA/AmiB activator)